MTRLTKNVEAKVETQKEQKEFGDKKGMTLIEVALALVVGILIYIGIIGPLMNSFKNSTIMNNIGSNVKAITTAANSFKANNSNSDGTFENVTDKAIIQYLPENMYLDGTDDDSCIRNKSNGSQICYKVKADKISSNGDSIKIYVDFHKLLSSTEKLKRQETKVMDSLAKYATSKDNVTQVGDASDIGDKDDDFTTDGNDHDGMVGVRKIAQ